VRKNCALTKRKSGTPEAVTNRQEIVENANANTSSSATSAKDDRFLLLRISFYAIFTSPFFNSAIVIVANRANKEVGERVLCYTLKPMNMHKYMIHEHAQIQIHLRFKHRYVNFKVFPIDVPVRVAISLFSLRMSCTCTAGCKPCNEPPYS